MAEWQSMKTAPKDRPIAIEFKSGAGWKVTGAQWYRRTKLWHTPIVALPTEAIARWHELPKGLGETEGENG